VPSYDGIYNAFRESPLYYLWVEPSIGFINDEAWLLLREEEQPVLSHMQMQDGEWAETERFEGVLGEGLRLLSDFTLNAYASPMELTISCYLTDSNVRLSNTFVRTVDSWSLCRFQMKEVEYLDVIGEQVLFDRTILPQKEGLVIQENGQEFEVTLAESLVLDLERYSAKDMLRICMAAMQGVMEDEAE
jgi:hypothetical protein